MRAPATAENAPLYDYTLMPTHMAWRFGIKELQNLELAAPFDFTRGVRTLKIPGLSWLRAHLFGTLLYDLAQDPGQLNPLKDAEIEQRMIKQLVELMRWNEAPPEQYERLGLTGELDQSEAETITNSTPVSSDTEA
jgi:hypothetical protein